MIIPVTLRFGDCLVEATSFGLPPVGSRYEFFDSDRDIRLIGRVKEVTQFEDDGELTTFVELSCDDA